jgi:large subunit ribosomal protein L29
MKTSQLLKSLRDLDAAQLNAKLIESQAALFNARFQKNLGTLEDSSVIKNIRREVARIKTIILEKSRGY